MDSTKVSSDPRSYLWENIRSLLIEGFSAEELAALCFDKFKPVHNQLSPKSGKTDIVQLLLQHTDQTLAVDELLAWAEKNNPAKYEQYQPYFSLNASPAPFQPTPVSLPGSGVAVRILVILVATIIFLLLALIVIQIFIQPNGVATSISPIPTSTPIPPMDEEDFNIAVATFSLAGEAATEPGLAEAGLNIADWLTDGIKDEKVLHPTIHATVREPDKVGLILGQDRETRALNAAQYANNNNVNILVYGVITGTNQNFFVEPEFYVNWLGFDYASEVAGPDQLGQRVPISSSLKALQKNDLNIELMSRRRVLHHVIYGLGYFFYNNHTEAFEEFDDASGEATDGGLEVVHLLKGAAKMREYNTAPCAKSDALMQAHAAFTQAYQLNASYARSYLGLGSVAMEQAKIFNTECTGVVGVKPDKLLEARNWFSGSLNLKSDDQSTPTPVQVKAAFSIGQVNLLGSQQDPTGSWSKAEARRLFQQAADAYQPGQRPDLVWVAGQAHANLGYLADLDKDWLTVFCECQRAIEILNTLPDKNLVADEIALYQQEFDFAKKQLSGDIACETVAQ